MKNFIFKSQKNFDFTKIISVLELIQKEQRHARYDLQVIQKDMKVLLKGIALMVSAPELEDNENDIGTDKDSRDGD